LNNEYYQTSYPFYLGYIGNPSCGGAAALTLGPLACSFSFPGGSFPIIPSSPIGYMKAGSGKFTCYDPRSGAATPCIPGGPWQTYYANNSTLAPYCTAAYNYGGCPLATAWTGPSPGYAQVPGASWDTLWDGSNNGPENRVKPEFANLSLSDEFRPNDKWLVDASLKYDNYNYGLASSNTLGDQFAAFQVANFACVKKASSQVLVQPLTPGSVPPPSPIFTSGDCNAAYDAAYHTTGATGWVHPNGTTQDGVTAPAFTNVSPSGSDQFYYSPRLAVTYTQNPDTVWRFSGGRFTAPPLSASVQYLYSSGAGATNLWTNFMSYGYYSPYHQIAGTTSAQYDLSWEHHLHATDWSVKITPFLTQTSNWEQQAFIGTGFVTGVPVGRFQSEGVEAAVTKGDFSRNGLSGQLAFTYTHAAAQYQNLGVPNLAQTMNAQISQFNVLTKAGGGAPCYLPFNGTVRPLTAAQCGQRRAISNPYYDYPMQGLLDPNGWYPASIFQLPPAFGPSYGLYAASYTSPYVATAILNYRQNKLAVTPSLQFESGVSYGSPMDVAGVDPRVCEGNQIDPPPFAPVNTPVPGGTKACNYLNQAGVGATGYLYIPNPQTLRFASLGQYLEPDLLTGNIQVSYDVSPKLRIQLTGANLFRTCFGGSAEPWTAATPPSPNVCGYATNGNYYTSNYYNGTSPEDRTANPGGGTIRSLLQSYGPSGSNGATAIPLPFTLFVQAQIRI
jgi:TonB dependent receptor